jgi:RNA polymerase sigma factor (TIGR02999 family)
LPGAAKRAKIPPIGWGERRDGAVEAVAAEEHVSDVTRILEAMSKGDSRAADRLLAAVYDELRRLASSKLARERPGQTLQATALVHEAYLRLLGGKHADWEGRGHFFAAAAEAMRRILVERARRKGRLKHGGGRKRLELSDADFMQEPDSIDLLALNEALEQFAQVDHTKAELVKLRYFTGLTVEQAGRLLGISRATADRYWTFARAWLYHEMSKGDESG